jgi:signal transduction histidine kinase
MITQLQTTSRKQILDQILHVVRQGKCGRVLGPRYWGKSRLILKAASILRDSGTHYTAYQSFLKIERDSESVLYGSLYSMMKDAFPVAPPYDIAAPATAREFQDAVGMLLRHNKGNFALFIDDVEMAIPNLVASLLGALRAVYMTTYGEAGAHLQVVVCGAFQLSHVSLPGVSSFERVSHLILVGDLDEQEQIEWITQLCAESNILPNEAVFQLLLEKTGGDYLLIRRLCRICFKQMKAKGERVMSAFEVENAIKTLETDPEALADILQALKPIETNPDLLYSVLQILAEGKVPLSKLRIASHESPNKLDLSGFFALVDDCYVVKCKLWQSLLDRYLTPERVGGLYSLTGKWTEAVQYLERAIHDKSLSAKSQLFITAISAIHRSEKTTQAIAYLGQALQAIYRHGQVAIYRKVDNSLILAYPEMNGHGQKRFSLDNEQAVEIRAFYGPIYTLSVNTDPPQILIPVGKVGVSNRFAGLISIHDSEYKKLTFQQREDIFDLVDFLQRAAWSIDRIEQSERYLQAAEQRSKQLHALNKILTHILPLREYSEEVILKVVLAGVTSGQGLGFNRAALFLPEENGRTLIGHLGVGHLSGKEARADWKKLNFKTIDNLIEAILKGEGKDTSMQFALKGMKIPLDVSEPDLLAQCFKSREPHLIKRQYLPANLSFDFAEKINPDSDFAVVPLNAGEKALGVLYVDDKTIDRDISEERFELLQTFVNQAALVLEVKAEAQRHLQRRQTVSSITALLSANFELENIFRTVLQAVCATVPITTNACIVELKDSPRELVIPLVCKDHYRIDQDLWTDEGYRVPIEDFRGIAGRVMQKGESEIVDDVDDDPDYIRAVSSTRSQLCVPIRRSEQVQEALVLESEYNQAFTEDDKRLLEALADHVAIAIQNAKQFEERTREREDARRTQMHEHLAFMATGLIHDLSKAFAGIIDVVKELNEEVARRVTLDEDISVLLSSLDAKATWADYIGERLKDFLVVGKLNRRLVMIEPIVRNAFNHSQQQHKGAVKSLYRNYDVNSYIYADSAWIDLLVQNLISNAYNAVVDKDDSLIEIEVSESPTSVFISVKDNGCGIAPEYHERIFEPKFSTQREQGKIHGVGLVHCLLIAAEHKGFLHLTSSEPNVGTVFTVTLPKPSEEHVGT